MCYLGQNLQSLFVPCHLVEGFLVLGHDERYQPCEGIRFRLEFIDKNDMPRPHEVFSS